MVRNGFIRKKVSSLTLGEKLKKLRSENRISLSEISKQTKIQMKYLEYLENGEYNKLPADVYVKGFLRSYASYLGVNENNLIKLYEREKGIQRNIKRDDKKEKLAEPIGFSNFIITPKKIVVSVIVLLALGSFFYIYSELDSFVSTPHLVVSSPIDGAVIEENSVDIKGKTEKGTEVFINDQPTLVSDAGEFSEKVGLQEGLNTISVKAKNRFDKEITQTIAIQANYEAPSEESLQSESEEPVNGNDQAVKLKIEIHVDPDPTWISVEEDGNLVYSGTLLPQAIQSFKASEKISITSGKGNNTYIKINGKDKGILSDNPGVVRDVTFTVDTKY
ncbi:MAG TPA: DUF4115 domain-containing protein [Candidatus Moranbacteria bacterium]|nr:DUF4115 domain-containing protein [Candidatus Moranbacteria bacterium]